MCYSVKEIREIRKLTQREAAEKLGVPLSTYRSWEEDISKVSVSKAVAITDLFGIRLSELCINDEAEECLR